jgi:hypothetical protein
MMKLVNFLTDMRLIEQGISILFIPIHLGYRLNCIVYQLKLKPA